MPDDASMPFRPRRETIVFVHGSLGGAEDAFAGQQPLRANYDVRVIVRRGYALDDDRTVTVDLERDADDLIESVPHGVHLVGTSTGGMVAMIAAGRRPDLVRSLTLIEPPAFALAADRPEVRHAIDGLKHHWTHHQHFTDREFLRGFFDALNMTRPVPDSIGPDLARAIMLLKTDRLWRLDAPVGAVADAGFPTLVIAGGWSPVYDAICLRLSALLGAELKTLSGFGHAVQKAGASFNLVLTQHIDAASKTLQEEI